LLARHFGVFPVELGNAGGALDFRDARNWIARSNDIVLLQADHVLNASAIPLATGSYGPHAKSTERLTGYGALLSVLETPKSDRLLGGFDIIYKSINEVEWQYQVSTIGWTDEVKVRFYAISVERRVTHPVVSAVVDAARETLFVDELS
jgi:hypothetical protein